jgi:hypothetical protein
LVVLPYGSGFGNGGVEDPPHKLAEVESLLGGVSRRIILGFTSELGHTSLLFRLVTDGPASEGEKLARTRLACATIVCLVRVIKAFKLEIVVRASPQRKAHVDGAMEVSKYLLQSLQVSVRGGGLGGAKYA